MSPDFPIRGLVNNKVMAATNTDVIPTADGEILFSSSFSLNMAK